MKFIAALLALVSLNAFANLNDLTVAVEQSEEQVLVKVKTGMRSSMCQLQVTELTIKNPQFKGLKLKTAMVEAGTIEVNFEQNPYSICMMAMGPHRGSLSLAKGLALPSLQKGAVYKLFVNGVEFEQLITVE